MLKDDIDCCVKQRKANNICLKLNNFNSESQKQLINKFDYTRMNVNSSNLMALVCHQIDLS